MKKLTLTIILLITIISPILSQEYLKMEVSLPKATYLLDEPIAMGISIRNSGNSVSDTQGNDLVLIKLFDSNDKELPYTGPIGLPFFPIVKILQPGEDFYYIISVEYDFGKDRRHFANKYLLPGRYTMKLYLRPQKKIVDSTTISFQVAEPSGEELNVHNEYIYAVTSTKSAEECVQILRRLADKYPNSCYLPHILDNLRLTIKYWLKDKAKAQTIEEELIEKCPGSIPVMNLINYKVKNMATKAERLEFLKIQQNRSKNTLMQKKINNSIQAESK